MIDEKLVLQLAAKDGVTPTEVQINRKLDLVKKQSGGDINRALAMRGMSLDDLKRQVELQQAFVNVVSKGVTISDDEVKKAYDQALNAKNSTLKRPEQVLVSGIVTKTKDKIDKAYKMLKEGQEFTAVVTRMSDDPNAKQSLGRLDWVAKDNTQWPAVIRDTAFSLHIGSYSTPVKIDARWAILRADQKRPAKVTSLSELKDIIKEELAVRKGSQAKFNKELKDFTKSADIIVNAERYKGIPEMMKKNASAPPAVAGAPAAPPAPQPKKK
jgi:parvulin-like peptidyl-prolyl isomerase